ncbi:MAG TPA: pilus assembly protein PilB, partial [Planctomycetes bacterium]|nr:pilus assembly protein PilB [Planctomycetota bacterium]
MALVAKPIGQILKDMELITELDIQEALQDQKSKGGALGRILVEKDLITDADLRIAIAKQSGMEPVDLDEVTVTADLLEMVPAHVAETYQVIPVEFDGTVLTLAVADPQNISALDDMKFMLNLEVKGALSDPESIERAMEKYYADRAESMESLLGSIDKDEIEVLDDTRHEMLDLDQLEKDVNAAPVVKLLNMVLLSAIKDRASDIHLEPFEKEFKIRYRVDGVLYE